jgi:hypothetical protein
VSAVVPDIREALRRQALACDELGSPFTARLCRLLADRLNRGSAVQDRLLGWPGDASHNGDNVPLRLTGALHALVLSGRDPGLAATYPPHAADDEALWAAVDASLGRDAAFIDHFLDNAPQTNEVARSAVLIAVGHLMAGRYPLPLVLSELGASAGLNLNWDRYALRVGDRRWGPPDAVLDLTPENRGTLPPPASPTVIDRRGVDLRPFDLAKPEQALRLTAYVWPDQTLRLDRLKRAMSLPPAPLDQGDAAAWLADRLATPRPGALHLVYNTIAWQYFPQATKEACAAALAEAGARATPEAPLAHFRMENDGTPPGAVLEVTTWPGGDVHPLGRVDFHGRWLDWTLPRLP